MSYLLTTYHWPLLSRPQVAGFKCPVTEKVINGFLTMSPIIKTCIYINRIHDFMSHA